jgi:threonylcarbamoyladenosine tRNA methylthiotransferase MtaB
MDASIRLLDRSQPTERRARFAICTLGCKLNQSDESDVRRRLRLAGLREVDFRDEADIYIVNTCTVTHLADRRSRQMLRRARRQNPTALVAAIGCYPSVAPDDLEAMSEVDLVVGSIEKLTVVDDILSHLGLPNQAFDLEPVEHGFETRTRRMIKIQEGCRAHCTYCVIPRARGAPRNISPDEVVRSVNQAVAEGYREVVLTGTHVGTYKWRRDDRSFFRLPDLLEKVLDETSIERLRVTSVGPHEIDARFIGILNHPRMMPHLHMALQSGSETVLRRMKRWYNLRQFRRAVRQLREQIPTIGLTTDIITGFPGETDDEFEETLAFVSEMQFSKLHVFPFSPRRGTPAAEMTDQVASRVKEIRSASLRELGEELSARFVGAHVGSELDVLIEQRRELGGTGSPTWNGFTGNYLKVYVPDTGVDLENQVVRLRGVEPMLDGLLATADAPTYQGMAAK